MNPAISRLSSSLHKLPTVVFGEDLLTLGLDIHTVAPNLIRSLAISICRSFHCLYAAGHRDSNNILTVVPFLPSLGGRVR